MRGVGVLIYLPIGYVGIHMRYLFNPPTLNFRSTKEDKMDIRALISQFWFAIHRPL